MAASRGIDGCVDLGLARDRIDGEHPGPSGSAESFRSTERSTMMMGCISRARRGRDGATGTDPGRAGPCSDASAWRDAGGEGLLLPHRDWGDATRACSLCSGDCFELRSVEGLTEAVDRRYGLSSCRLADGADPAESSCSRPRRGAAPTPRRCWSAPAPVLSRLALAGQRFARLEHFPTKWIPVRRRKCGKIKEIKKLRDCNAIVKRSRVLSDRRFLPPNR
jgi:hypothetical protein